MAQKKSHRRPGTPRKSSASSLARKPSPLDEQTRLAAIVESSDDAIIAKSLHGIILHWNPAAEKLFGYAAAEAVGKPITIIVPADHLKEERQILRRIKRGEPVDHYDTVRVSRSGRVITVSISVSPLRDTSGKIIAASTIMRDVTERRRAELALHDEEQRLQAIVNTATDAIITIDERGTIESVNPAAQLLFGYDRSELLGANVSRLMPQPYRTEHDGYLATYLRTGRAKIIGIGREVTGLRKDGTTFPINLSVSEVNLNGRRLFTGIVHDLSGRRQLERQILEAASNEQRRIGQDLHDGLCQDLVGIAFGIDAAARSLPLEAGTTAASLATLAESVRDSAGQARNFAHGLNPVDLKSGLWSALDTLAKKVSQSFGVHCTFHWDQVAQIRDETTATHLYRIAQEAVSNAVRHGKASQIEISFASRAGTLLLAIADNGIGIPKNLTEGVKQGLPVTRRRESGSRTPGIGLQTMHFRARVIGGAFSVANRKGGGTVITCTLRFEPSANHRARKPPRSPRWLTSGKSSRLKGGRPR